ncbi:hypothetical protein AYL99_02453 [Fonsecaea erecta]|uniref:Uncharacterized protein n=1 Tax=Fonsecaea erecta TaxID=1367422 RepID=A0A178ZUW3_9EURO|nr:hypothetical protein AYL99_02453 [Fonsecaea erecta]OAP63226.1 hypothetical protein AYL99_02453 [Fonsecaea erecta]
MSRPPSVTSYHHDELSSPDPLATCVNDEPSHGNIAHGSRQPAPKRHSSTAMKTTGRSANTSTFGYEALAPSSPFRAVSEQNLSPWKIRVTVEAEPEDANMESSALLTKSRTRTTRRSLQHENPEVEGPKNPARGGKSPSRATKNKRSETPGAIRRNSGRSRRQSVTDLDIIPLGDDADEDDWLKQKKSPRKRRNSRKSASTPVVSTQKASPTKSSRSNASASGFEVRPDTDTEDSGGAEEQENGVAESQSPELRTINLNQVSVRPRALSTKSNVEQAPESEDAIVSGKTRNTSMKQQMEVRKVSVNSALSYPTPSPTSSYHGDSDDVGRALDDNDSPIQHENEAFDTILESEGFTMIDLDTLPSVRRITSSPLDGGSTSSLHPSDIDDPKTHLPTTGAGKRVNGDLAASNPSATFQTITYPAIRPDESELSSTVPSSPPASDKSQGLLKVPSSSTAVGRKVTPLPYSSPKLPSPPRPNVRRTPHHQHRASAGAVFAGIALQEVMSPARSGEGVLAGKQDTSSNANYSRPEEDRALFVGFDCGTQRELRAGLRFGEELAKRLASSPEDQTALTTAKNSEPNKISNTKIPVSSEQNSRTQVWRGENLVQHTPVHTSGSSEPSREVTAVHTPPNPARDYADNSLLDTQARRERDWQLEREAISREIQNASESQVIVIDSDDEEEQPTPRAERQEVSHLDLEFDAGDETDIWLAEAKNSSSPGLAVQSNADSLFTHTERIKQRQRAQEVVNRPRRSLIPSPWKRGENLDAPQERSTLLSAGSEEASTLIFYNEPENKIRFGAGEIKREQLRLRRNSGKFDIDLMAGTPRGEAAEDGNADITDTIIFEGDEPEEDTSVAPGLSSSTAESEASNLADELDEVGDLANEISQSSGTLESSPQAVRIPVNFNDSSISISTPPPRPAAARAQPLDRNEARENSPTRPPTPRSAMKGSRYSCNQGLGTARPDATDMIRKVVFSQRSRGVDVDGQESSFSMRSSTDDSFEDSVGIQLNQDLQAVEKETRRTDDSPPAVLEGDFKSQGTMSVTQDEPSVANPTQNHDRLTVGQSEDLIKPTMSSRDQPQNPAWAKTKASISSSDKSSKKTEANSHRVPSYLTPPSYPSDPLRSIKKPLALTGDFSNTHFRTLHIIYRKSLRPKFHAPPRTMIRPEVHALRGTEMVVDESANGLVRGEFAWTVGDGECEVLERFMQECEYSHGWYKGQQMRPDAAEEIKWGWSVKQLAEWLCRIVVGEVVRDEERKAKGQ